MKRCSGYSLVYPRPNPDSKRDSKRNRTRPTNRNHDAGSKRITDTKHHPLENIPDDALWELTSFIGVSDLKQLSKVSRSTRCSVRPCLDERATYHYRGRGSLPDTARRCVFGGDYDLVAGVLPAGLTHLTLGDSFREVSRRI